MNNPMYVYSGVIPKYAMNHLSESPYKSSSMFINLFANIFWTYDYLAFAERQ